MRPLQSPGPSNASLGRRQILSGGLALGLAACGKRQTLTASRTPRLNTERLAQEIPVLAERAKPGVLGFGLMNLESGEHWVLNGDRHFPMQSVFKAPLAAAALAEVDARRLDLNEFVTIEDVDLSPFWSPIVNDGWPARRTFSYGALLAAALVESDNTAADVLMKRIGGPGAVTAWLQARRINDLRVDRYERELQADAHAAPSFRAEWRGAGYSAQIRKVDPARRRAAMAAYMADPRDTATPNAMLDFLAKLDAGELLSAASTRRMIQLMRATTRGNDRLKAGLSADVQFAHRPGTSGADLGVTMAFNDVGIMTLPDKRSYAVAAFLSGSTADEAVQAALLADIARLTARSLG